MSKTIISKYQIQEQDLIVNTKKYFRACYLKGSGFLEVLGLRIPASFGNVRYRLNLHAI